MPLNEKKVPALEVAPPSSSMGDISDIDKAYTFIQTTNSASLDTASVDLKALRRKIDFRIIPMMLACYTMQVFDKVDINYAAVMGLNKDLHLTGNNFSDAATAFYIAFLIAEVPNGYILQKVPAGKWLGFNVTAWGIITACFAATKGYHGLLTVRIFLGMFEASIAPSLMLISSQYYTRSEQATRFCFWFCGLPIAQVLGGLVSYAFQHVGPGHLEGWRIMFIVLGVATVLIGLGTAYVLPDSPMSAKFLTEREKVALLVHVSENRTGIENRHFKLSQLVELFFDVQMWLMAMITILISISSGVINTYSSTLIKQIGYTSKEAALLGMPTGAISLIWTFVVGFGSRYTSHRWAWLISCCLPGILGGGLMSYAPKENHAAVLTGVYLVNAITPTLIVLYQWTISNVAGHTKKVAAAALIAGSFSIGNIIGPETFRAKDAPEYHKAKVIVLATQSAAAVVTVILFGYYVWANRLKEKSMRRLESEGVRVDTTEDVWGNLTDKQNPEFRYVY